MGWVAGILSLVWFGAIGLYLSGWETGVTAFDKILKLDPNNFGDFMSGAFAPVAFFWLAYSVIMQRQELKLQRLELAETREVLKDQGNSQERLADETRRASNLTERNQIDEQIQYVVKRICAIAASRPYARIHWEEGDTILWNIPKEMMGFESIYIYSYVIEEILKIKINTEWNMKKDIFDNYTIFDKIVLIEAMQVEIVYLCEKSCTTGHPRSDEILNRNLLKSLSACVKLLGDQISAK